VPALHWSPPSTTAPITATRAARTRWILLNLIALTPFLPSESSNAC
jgi:hypothetical protein